MKINSEVEKTIFDLNITFEESEYDFLLTYAKDNMSIDIKNEMLINWALIEVLKKYID
jgi:hypothetical protein